MAEEQIEQPEQPEQVEQPTIDPKLAMQIAADQFGVTPDYLEGAIRLQDENRRQIDYFRNKEKEIERREAQIEALARERQQYLPPRPQLDIDPVVQPVYQEVAELKRLIMDERKERAQQVEFQQTVQQTARQLDQNYLSVMRGVPTHSQVDKERFFAAMSEIYPTETGALPPGITPERAVLNTAKYLGLNPSGMSQGYTPRTNGNPMRDPRAQFVIPGGTTGPGPSMPAGSVDTAPQRPGESLEQYNERLKNALQGMTLRQIPENVRFSSG